MEPSSRWRRLVAGLVGATAAWMVFDGFHALATGDFVTPRTGEYAGQLGPWAALLRAAGIEPRSVAVAAGFVTFGLAWLVALAAWLRGRHGAALGLGLFSAVGLLYLPFGTVAGLAALGALAAGRARRAAAPG